MYDPNWTVTFLVMPSTGGKPFKPVPLGNVVGLAHALDILRDYATVPMLLKNGDRAVAIGIPNGDTPEGVQILML